MTTLSTAELHGLAQCFAEQLHHDMRADDLMAAVVANAAEGANSPVCHTHDYIDSNESMLAAWREMFGGEPDASNDDDAAARNAAWAIAQRHGFSPAAIADAAASLPESNI